MPDNASTSPPPASPMSILSYRGRMGRLAYFIGISVAGLILLGAVWALVHASTPTATTDTAPLVLMLLPLFFWVHSLVTVNRLRDAGLPAWHYVFYVVGAMAWLALVGPSTESDALLLAGIAAIFILPALYKRKPAAAAEAEPV
jgi:uncharacterized membrane protein YhaH (DUF805 family)